ncbi:MAG: pantetheine-phosphate adenylyltransferase [Clostridia bacterium]|nr:pantetheine-phosphate adenylyltransferase [Clostridia bacterium]
MKALFAGSFHPPTKGHLDVIERASKIYEKVYVAVMYNAEKHYTLSVEDRTYMLKKITKDFKNVEIVSDDGLTAELAKKIGCEVLIRGLRNGQDFEYELPIALANKKVFGIETVFLCCEPENMWISSTIVNDLVRHGGDISKLVPGEIEEDILRAQQRISKGV